MILCTIYFLFIALEIKITVLCGTVMFYGVGTGSYFIHLNFQKAVELNPSDPTSHYMLGNWYAYM